MAFPKPLYFFSKYWLHKIYSRGLDAYVSEYLNEAKEHMNGLDSFEFVELLESEANLFFWSPVSNCWSDDHGMVLQDTIGQRLFAKEETAGGYAYQRIVDVRKDDTTGKFRLFASKQFDFGDVITFISSVEENTGKLVLGGTHARRTNNSAHGNAYLTSNGALRCTKALSEGDEIVRWTSDEEPAIELLERIDRVVISTDRMLIGRIAARSANDGMVVNYTDGTKEVANFDTDICYAFRDENIKKMSMKIRMKALS